MILGRILDHLAKHKVASLGEIARALNAAPDAVRSMLETLQRRDLVHQVKSSSACGTSCRQCAQAGSELYGHGPAPDLEQGVSPCQSVKLR